MNDRLSGRNGLIWAAYVRGATQEAIAAEHGIDQSQVSRAIKEVRDSIPQATREEIIQREVEILDHLRREAMALVDAPPIPAYSQGRPITLPSGATAEDHSGRVRAMGEVRAISKRLAEVVGSDAPTKQEVAMDGGLRYEIVGVTIDEITGGATGE